MLERRGSVFIAPADFFTADGRMVDPACAHFWVSWQNDDGGEGALEDNEVVGAEAAIAWGRKRSAEIWIRLGHRGDTYFWAGEGQQPVEEGEDPYPDWPPSEPPPGGWFTPREGPPLVGIWDTGDPERLGVVEPEVRTNDPDSPAEPRSSSRPT